MDQLNWYHISNINEWDTPALVVYPDRVRHNIAEAIAMIGDAGRLRPHAKTHKNREAALLMINSGISKFKCATIAEAEMLAMCDAADVLLAYQPVGPKLGRFIKLMAAYSGTAFSCLVDNIAAAADISEAATAKDIQIAVYIDINIGQNRTGIIPSEALQLYLDCSKLPGIKLNGLHAYDGHIHAADLQERTAACNAGFLAVEQLKQEIIQQGLAAPVVIAGGSPTFPIHIQRADVECSPGTFVYWDMGYLSAFKEQAFLPAALVVGRVISLPAEDLICIDIGHKSVSAENDISKRIYFLNAPGLIITGQSEEHLVANAGKGHHYQIGDVLYGLPHHICPTVALYERAITIENHIAAGEWKNLARDRKITI